MPVILYLNTWHCAKSYPFAVGFLISDHYIPATDFYLTVSSSGVMPYMYEVCSF